MLMIRNARQSNAEGISALLNPLEHPSTPTHIRMQLQRIGADDNETVLLTFTRQQLFSLIGVPRSVKKARALTVPGSIVILTII